MTTTDLLPAGTYTGKIVNYAVTETKKGDAQIGITFAIEGATGPRNISWFGNFHENAREFTVKQVLYCGFKGNDLGTLIEGVAGNALRTDLDLALTVEHHTWEEKTTARVAWINPVGGRGFDKMDPVKAKSSLGQLSGLVASVRQETKIDDTTYNTEDLPF